MARSRRFPLSPIADKIAIGEQARPNPFVGMCADCGNGQKEDILKKPKNGLRINISSLLVGEIGSSVENLLLVQVKPRL